MPAPTGEALKNARLAAGLSQAQAAELIGVPIQVGTPGRRSIANLASSGKSNRRTTNAGARLRHVSLTDGSASRL